MGDQPLSFAGLGGLISADVHLGYFTIGAGVMLRLEYASPIFGIGFNA